ncbi:MAG: hypothetical protein ACJ77X_05220 [Chloroflexota bacterium]
MSTAPSFLRDRAALERVAWRVIFGIALVLSAFWIIGFYVEDGAKYLFIDVHVYFRATQAWLDGSNPWTTTYLGVPFAGIPPTLLLNVPFIPLGEDVAVAFWAVANTAAIVLLVRRLHLPLWVVVVQPVLEGWLGGSPDLALAGAIVVGMGWLAALTKPYSAPALVADRRWLHLGVAGVVGIITIPLLPWFVLYESRAIVAESFANFAGNPVSAAGSPLLILAVIVALVSLGWRRGWALFTPGLLAQQPHYIVFSLQTVVSSRILALAMTIPIAHAAAVGVIAYAIVQRWRGAFAPPAVAVGPEPV